MLRAEKAARFAAHATAVLVLAFVLAPSSATAARRDRQRPSTPTNLRITAITSYTVSLAWNPSSDNVGVVRYHICCANVSSQQVVGSPPPASVVYTAGLEASRPFTLRVYAVDAAGNYSNASNSVSFTTPPDTTPPATPVVSVTGVGPTHVALLWSLVDEGPIWYDVRLNGALVIGSTRNTSAVIPLLQPTTTYTVTVRARDFANNQSPPSDPVTATTPAPNPDDVTPPTTPVLTGAAVSGCEVDLDWSESTDDFDPQFAIEYEIYLNGVHVDSTALRFTRTVVYANQNGVNTFAVAAVDSAGNRSELSQEFSEVFDGCVF